MEDTISRQALLDKFEPWLKVKDYNDGELNMLKAILYEIRFMPSALSTNLAEVGTDYISRQAAIDAVYYAHGTGMALKAIKQLPSAQPEIIRCKDCKWYGRADKRRFYRGTDCLNHRIDTIVPDKDYCSRAERRTDE